MMDIQLEEIINHLTERGRLEWDLAVAKAHNERLVAEVQRLQALETQEED